MHTKLAVTVKICNKLGMHVMCPAARPFKAKRLPSASDRGSSTLGETRGDPDISTPKLTRQFFHQILEKTTAQSRSFPPTQNKALEDLSVNQRKKMNWHENVAKKSWTGMKMLIFVLRKKGSGTKERMKEEEIEKGDCGPPTRKVFFWDFVGLEPNGTWSPRRRESSALAGYTTGQDGPVVYPANALDSRLRGDQVPFGSSPTKSQKKMKMLAWKQPENPRMPAYKNADRDATTGFAWAWGRRWALRKELYWFYSSTDSTQVWPVESLGLWFDTSLMDWHKASGQTHWHMQASGMHVGRSPTGPYGSALGQ